ncbi:UNVERIFIED_CONTAM: putative late blight resistance proteinR1A-10 [Sesamum radiatum]|uniref:Late blight resistance proteinR1A-10 n=1 Tax=Sesamum radiatum TaxID=300843 RepID=A0AAW2UM38_SESRA
MAYAAVVLLMQSLEQILQSDHSHLLHVSKDQIGSLLDEVNFLKLFLQEDSDEREHDHQLEIQIRDAALKAADFIDSRLYISQARRATACSPEESIGWKQISLIAHRSFPQIVKEIKSIKSEVVQLFEKKSISDRKFIMPSDFTPIAEEDSNKLVGLDDDIVKLLNQLCGFPLHRQVIPIVGMGGIGKTTLAGRIYNDPFTIYHFYVRAWITIPQKNLTSQPYRVRGMFLGLLKCFANVTYDARQMTNEELGEKVYKALKGMRYLVVLDDMWQTRDWDVLKRFLPDDKNGSRVMLTSRLGDIAAYVHPSGSAHHMHFLQAAESWKLLESKLFPKESCPKKLIQIGKRIAVKCEGLPLAIVVVAGILSKMDRTQRSWTKLAESVDRSIVAEDPEHCKKILALSYDYLPNFLKACFLYMGAFPKDYEIPVSRLIWLWIAEGFVLPVRSKCLEDVANDYLEDLVNRNLILVGKRRLNGRIKTCRIHDLLRELCMIEAQNKNFLHVIERYTQAFLVGAVAPRRISLLLADILHLKMRPMPLTRSFMLYDMHKNLPDMFLLKVMDRVDFKLLRVLDIELLQSNHFPIEIVELIHLRYLALAINCELPGSIFKLQNLQTLIIDHIWDGQYLPREIWMMPQLRHIRLKRGCYFPRPHSRGIKEKSQLVLQNLQTLSTLTGPVSCSQEVFACLPALKKLEIFATEGNSQAEQTSEYFSNLACLDQLETLKCSFLYGPRNHRLPSGDLFPANLKKLTLSGSFLPWEDMAKLAVLPKLEVLKLRSFAFEGDVWRAVEGGFFQLKLLLVENSDPPRWDADASHFPNLQQLVLRECHRLTEIPQGIGDITTLQTIEVQDCSFCIIRSAGRIHQQQQMLGNDELGIRIITTSGDNHSGVLFIFFQAES